MGPPQIKPSWYPCTSAYDTQARRGRGKPSGNRGEIRLVGIFGVFEMPSLVSRVDSFCNFALDAVWRLVRVLFFLSAVCWLLFAPVGRSTSFPYVVSATPLRASGSHPSSPCSFISLGLLCRYPPRSYRSKTLVGPTPLSLYRPE